MIASSPRFMSALAALSGGLLQNKTGMTTTSPTELGIPKKTKIPVRSYNESQIRTKRRIWLFL